MEKSSDTRDNLFFIKLLEKQSTVSRSYGQERTLTYKSTTLSPVMLHRRKESGDDHASTGVPPQSVATKPMGLLYWS